MPSTRTPVERHAPAAVAERIVALGAVAVLRLPDARGAVEAVAAVHAGGVSAIEVTMTTPGALEILAEVRRRLGEAVLLGVGSVLDAATAGQAIEAGARFVVSPALVPAVLAEAHRRGAAAIPGAFTPTELLRAHEVGADLVKVFPSDTLGPAYLKAVLAPMPFLRLIPTGGVTPENAGAWIRAGAVAVGAGSALLDPALVAAGDVGTLTERGRRLASGVVEARAALAGSRP